MTILFLCWRARFSKSRVECSKAKSTSYGEKILPLDNSGVEQKYESSPSFWICCYCYSLIGNNQFQVFSGRHKKREPFCQNNNYYMAMRFKVCVCLFTKKSSRFNLAQENFFPLLLSNIAAVVVSLTYTHLKDKEESCLI